MEDTHSAHMHTIRPGNTPTLKHTCRCQSASFHSRARSGWLAGPCGGHVHQSRNVAKEIHTRMYAGCIHHSQHVQETHPTLNIPASASLLQTRALALLASIPGGDTRTNRGMERNTHMYTHECVILCVHSMEDVHTSYIILVTETRTTCTQSVQETHPTLKHTCWCQSTSPRPRPACSTSTGPCGRHMHQFRDGGERNTHTHACRLHTPRRPSEQVQETRGMTSENVGYTIEADIFYLMMWATFGLKLHNFKHEKLETVLLRTMGHNMCEIIFYVSV